MSENMRAKLKWVIHGVVLIISVIFLGIVCEKASNATVMETGIPQIVCIVITAFIVNIIKAVRMYVIMFGYEFSICKFIRFYIVTAFANITIPFKCGELYRGYYLGVLLGSFSEGYLMVIFDRFVDTLALISIVIGVNIFLGTDMGVVYLLLSGFLFIALTAYLLFPPLYKYWNHYLIFNRSSKNTLKALHFLEVCHKTFEKISGIANGRFVMLYIISLAAWIVEISSILIVNSDAKKNYVSEYLKKILTGETTQYNFFFILGSLVLFAILAVVCLFQRREKGKNETSSCI